jgi:transmembrane sensor
MTAVPNAMSDDCAARIDESLKREARDWVMRLSCGPVTAADAAAVKSWRATSRAHRKAFAEANRLWDMATLGAVEAVRDGAPAVWARQDLQARRTLHRRAFLGGSFAASAAGAAYLAVRPPLHLWPAVFELAADVRTTTGEQRHVTVGGAAIELNTNTSMNLPPATNDADRVELVEGEAAITTAAVASRPVTVLAADGRSMASGAEFNVRYDGNEVRVTCLTGTVRVSCGADTVSLTKNQQVSYGHGRLGDVAEIDSGIVTAWREGLLVFRNDPLTRVVEEVNRYRPGRIIVMNSELGRKLIFASFRLDRLDEVVTRVEKVFGARVRTLPGGVVILS